MKVSKQSVRDGSCNFCKRGKLNKYGQGLSYPYETVYQFSSDGSGLCAIACQKCLDELNAKSKSLK